jgi:eight-cysteine-cluster-containing protein
LSKKILALVLIASLALLFAGCTLYKENASASASPEPTIPPLPSEAPNATPSEKCFELERGACCLGNVCSEVELNCIQGSIAVFRGCDADCNALAECVPIPSSEACSNDADCMVGGCSNELCGLRGEELVSTCVWKPEFTCFEKTKCGCVDGQCAWKHNEVFDACTASGGLQPN